MKYTPNRNSFWFNVKWAFKWNWQICFHYIIDRLTKPNRDTRLYNTKIYDGNLNDYEQEALLFILAKLHLTGQRWRDWFDLN